MISLNTPFAPKFIATVLAAILAAWFYFSKSEPVKKTTSAPVAEEVKDSPKEAIQPVKVIVYTPAAKKKTGLPKDVVDNAVKHVAAASDIPASEHDVTVITIVDSDTGVVENSLQEQPLPWFKAENKWQLRLDYGLRNGLVPAWRTQIQGELIEIKSLHFGCTTDMYTDGQWFTGFGVAYHF